MRKFVTCPRCKLVGVAGSFLACGCQRPSSSQFVLYTPSIVANGYRAQSGSSNDVDCLHRGERIGTADCGCSGKPVVHWCNLMQGHCSIYSTAKTWDKVGDITRVGKLAPCVTCDKRKAFNWKQVDGIRVGFVAGMYNKIGGTESFHQLLLPNIDNAVGFASLRGNGDLLKLGVPAAFGPDAVSDLLRNCDVAVCWAVPELAAYMPVKRPKVINCHHGGPNQPWANDNLTSAFDVTDKIVCVHPKVAEQYGAVYIPNAIDPNRTTATHDSSHDWITRLKYPITDSTKILLWSHRMSSEKRPELAIRIAAALPDDWFTVIAGGGWYKPTIEPNPARVRMEGPVTNPKHLLSIADCFLSTAEAEGFGLAMGEAMASGVPVVATPEGLGADPRLVTQVAHDASIDEWVEAILSRSRGDTVTHNARRIVEKEFGVAEHVKRWEGVISA